MIHPLYCVPNHSIMRKITYLLALYLIFISYSCSSPEKNIGNEIQQERIARIENGLKPVLQIEGEEVHAYNLVERLEELGIPGLSLAVAVDGKIEWAKGYGMADVGENRFVDTETMFLAGSISKPVAAVRAHQLVEA